MKKQIVTIAVKVLATPKNQTREGNPNVAMPDWGLGPGILARQELVIKDPKGNGFENPVFGAYVYELMEDLLHSTVECYVESTKDL